MLNISLKFNRVERANPTTKAKCFSTRVCTLRQTAHISYVMFDLRIGLCANVAHGYPVDPRRRVYVPESHGQDVRGQADNQPLGKIAQLQETGTAETGLPSGTLRSRPLRRCGE